MASISWTNIETALNGLILYWPDFDLEAATSPYKSCKIWEVKHASIYQTGPISCSGVIN